MSKITNVAEVEAALLELHKLQNQIRDAEEKRDQSIAFYKQRIDEAKKVFDTDAAQLQFDIGNISIDLKKFYDANPPARGKSLKFAGGSFGYHKQETRYKIGDSEASADNLALLDFVKNGHEDFLRVKESVDWKKLKSELTSDGQTVYLNTTGEIIPDMQACPQPDRFSIKTQGGSIDERN